ncbi:hypothetical protein TWF481_001461 [Arthrobotrys musiformis]|uniref:NACHT domain-containing protein n=1 Tax=Arthrobotrys musiformis TaxID=47236 RepID=A0AAV9WSQ8_9PEZI
MRNLQKTLRHDDYTIGWISALPLEMAAATMMLDEVHNKLPQQPSDQNSYTLGSVHGHNVAIACLPSGVYGTTSAAIVAAHMLATFHAVRFVLMVGIGGGVPGGKSDVRLGDVVVSKPSGTNGGVIQYDFGKTMTAGQFQRVGCLNKPPHVLLTAVSALEAHNMGGQSQIPTYLSQLQAKSSSASKFAYVGQNSDQVYEAGYDHSGGETCSGCDRSRLVSRAPRRSNNPRVHYGLIASGNQVMKNGATRDKLARSEDPGILCFEMEAAGMMDQVPCLVIRGICDYCDSHKNKAWQGYAAAVAAAYAKELLQGVSIVDVSTTSRVKDIDTLSVATMILAASVASFLCISGGVVACLQSRGARVSSDALGDVLIQLPAISDSLERIVENCKTGLIPQEEQTKLLPVVTGCLNQASTLQALIDRLIPTPEDSKLRRIKKLTSRFQKAGAVSSSLSILEGYKSTITMHLQQRTAAQVSNLNKTADIVKEIKLEQRQQTRAISLDWLKPRGIGSSHPERIPGTCEWIRNQESYIKWMEASPSTHRLLSVQGVSGCGKSVLATFLARDVQIKGFQVLFFSFSGTDNRRQKIESLARAFLWELLQRSSDDRAHEIANDLEKRRPLTTEDMFEALLLTIKIATGPIYCIIDGVDECTDECNNPRSGLLYYVQQMVELDNCRVALFGRPRVLQAASRLKVSLNIEITFELVKSDIRKLAASKINGCEDWESLSPEDRDHISNMLVSGSDGMFLWVELMAADLNTSPTREILMEKLRNMPRGMENVYRTRFSKLLDQYSQDDGIALARKILAFTIAAPRRMTVDELWHCLTLDNECGPRLRGGLIMRRDKIILNACVDLVTITGNCVELVHFSVQEFLTRPKESWMQEASDRLIESMFRVDFESAHLGLASICIDYLSTGECGVLIQKLAEGEAPSSDSKYPLLAYSSSSFILHLARSGTPPRPQISTKFDKFLGSKGFGAWVEYVTLLVLGGSNASLDLIGDLAILENWAKSGSDTESGIYHRKFQMALRQNVQQRILDFGATDPRTRRLQVICNHLEGWDHFFQGFGLDGEDTCLEGLEASSVIETPETASFDPALQGVRDQTQELQLHNNNASNPRDSSHAASQLMNLIGRYETAQLPAKFDLLLKLGALLRQSKVIYDPLKLLLEAILNSAQKVPGQILYMIGDFFYGLKRYDDARRVYQVALSKGVHVNAHLKLLLLYAIGSAWAAQGDSIKAGEAHREALKEFEQDQEVYGPHYFGHSYYVTAYRVMNYLGNNLYELSSYVEAEYMYRRSVEGRQKLLGHDHRDTLITISNVGRALSSQERHPEAEQMYRRALKGLEKILSDDDSRMIDEVLNLGDALYTQQRYHEAEEMYRRAVEGQQKLGGYDDPVTLEGIESLGHVLFYQEKFPEAEEMYRRAFVRRQHSPGAGTLDTLYSARNLAKTLNRQGKDSEAEGLYRIALEGQRELLGHEHENAETFQTAIDIGDTLYWQQKYSEAEEMYKHILKGPGALKFFTSNYLGTLKDVYDLGHVFLKQKEYLRAGDIFRLALEWRERILGNDHFDTFLALFSLECCLYQEGNSLDELELVRRKMDKKKFPLGREDRNALIGMRLLGDTLSYQRRDSEAEELLLRALRGNEKQFGYAYGETLACVNTLGWALFGQGAHRALEVKGILKEAMRLENLEEICASSGDPTLFDSLKRLDEALDKDIESGWSLSEPRPEFGASKESPHLI